MWIFLAVFAQLLGPSVCCWRCDNNFFSFLPVDVEMHICLFSRALPLNPDEKLEVAVLPVFASVVTDPLLPVLRGASMQMFPNLRLLAPLDSFAGVFRHCDCARRAHRRFDRRSKYPRSPAEMAGAGAIAAAINLPDRTPRRRPFEGSTEPSGFNQCLLLCVAGNGIFALRCMSATCRRSCAVSFRFLFFLVVRWL